MVFHCLRMLRQQIFFETEIYAWSYIPSLDLLLKPFIIPEYDTKLLLGSQFSYLYVEASNSDENIGNFTSKGSVWKNSAAVEQSLNPAGDRDLLLIRPSIARIEVFGDVKDGFEFGSFYEFGLDIFSRSILENYFDETGFGVRHIYEEEVQGWRFGFFGSLA